MDKVLIVTGGSQGIGAATCRLAARRGWAVCFSYSQDVEAADRVAAEITAAGGRALPQHADASDEAAVIALFDAAAELGPVTALVNNAGITGPVSDIVDLEAAALDRVLAVNVRGAYLAVREAARRMEAGGAIVNVSSRASQLGGPGEWVHYATSKGAVDTLTVGAARELAPRGIRVNAVLPGLMDTPMARISATRNHGARPEDMDEVWKQRAARIPMGWMGDAFDVARAVSFLASDEARFITGQTLVVDGGMTLGC